MSLQMSLDGLDAPSEPTDRLFLALFPPPEVAQRIAVAWQAQRQALGLKGRIVEADRLHVTLMHLGDHPGLPPGLEQAARQAAATLSSQPAFEVCFDRLDNFRKSRDLHIQVLLTSDGAAALQAFQAALTTALHRAGLARWMDKRAGFTPHVSLQYSAQLAPPQAVEPVRWRVEGFALVNSKLKQHLHQHLATWPLQG